MIGELALITAVAAAAFVGGLALGKFLGLRGPRAGLLPVLASLLAATLVFGVLNQMSAASVIFAFVLISVLPVAAILLGARAR
jgi:hypothetical protein